MNKEEIVKLVEEMERLDVRILSEAEGQFEPEDCPLSMNGGSHYSRSEKLFGCGCWQWECGFCGKEDGE